MTSPQASPTLEPFALRDQPDLRSAERSPSCVLVGEIAASLSAAATPEEVGDAIEAWATRLVDPATRVRTWIPDGPELRAVQPSTLDDEAGPAVRKDVWLGAEPRAVSASN